MRTYVMREKDTNYYKLGRVSKSKKLRTRWRNIQVGNPREVIVVKVYDGDRESELHELFASYRTRGEWFELPPEAELPVWQEASYSLDLEPVDIHVVRKWEHKEYGVVTASISELCKMYPGLRNGSLYHLVREERTNAKGWRLIG